MMRRTHPTPINFVFLFPKLTDGQLSLHKIQIVCTLYSFTSPRIEKLKFSYFGTYEQSYVGLYFFDNPYERIISKLLRPNAPHTPNQFGSNIFFHKLRLCMSNLESSQNDLVVYSSFLDDSRFSQHKLSVLRKRTSREPSNELTH